MTSNPVLCLSSGYLPVNTVTWEKAISWVISGRAVIERIYEEEFVCSTRTKIPQPSVIRFISKMQVIVENKVTFNRKNVWLRDKGLCQFCGKRVAINNFTFDHVIPKCSGGKTNWNNIVTSCYKCNQKKSNKTVSQAGFQLLRMPYEPKFLFGSRWFNEELDDIPEEWKDFISLKI